MKIELRIQQYHGRTDRHMDRQTHGHTEGLLELLVGAKKSGGKQKGEHEALCSLGLRAQVPHIFFGSVHFSLLIFCSYMLEMFLDNI